MSESFAELFEESLAHKEMGIGDIITAEVVRIDGNFVVVNADLKSESIIPISEFADEGETPEVKIGDFVSVTIENIEDGYGSTVLSRERARKLQAWEELDLACLEKRTVEGMVLNRVKGGMAVVINGLRAFLPGSLLDVRQIKDMTPFENKPTQLKVIKLDRERNNIVVSRKAVLEEKMIEDRDSILNRLDEGSVVKGVIKNITDYGAFVDLGGIDGLLHITDLSWKRVKHPSEVVKAGEEVDVKIIKFDRDNLRISLGLKQLTDDPWQGIEKRYPPKSRVFGSISNILDYGIFVEIEAGVEGLVHVSEMDWRNKNIVPAKAYQEQQEVEVMVLEIDESKRRLSLGIKQCQTNPWEEFQMNHKKGSKLTGAIRSITDFGMFVALPNNIDGLVHLSDISWNKPGELAIRDYTKGQEIEVMVLGVEIARERISLGIKQLIDDPFIELSKTLEKHNKITVTIKEVDSKGISVEIAEGVEGYIRASESGIKKGEELTDAFSIGKQIEAAILNIDKKSRLINLSISILNHLEQLKAMEKMQQDNQQVSSGTNLGALLKAKINENETEKHENNENEDDNIGDDDKKEDNKEDL